MPQFRPSKIDRTCGAPRALDLHSENGQAGGASTASCIYVSDVASTDAERAARASNTRAVAAVVGQERDDSRGDYPSRAGPTASIELERAARSAAVLATPLQ